MSQSAIQYAIRLILLNIPGIKLPQHTNDGWDIHDYIRWTFTYKDKNYEYTINNEEVIIYDHIQKSI